MVSGFPCRHPHQTISQNDYRLKRFVRNLWFCVIGGGLLFYRAFLSSVSQDDTSTIVPRYGRQPGCVHKPLCKQKTQSPAVDTVTVPPGRPFVLTVSPLPLASEPLLNNSRVPCFVGLPDYNDFLLSLPIQQQLPHQVVYHLESMWQIYPAMQACIDDYRRLLAAVVHAARRDAPADSVRG